MLVIIALLSREIIEDGSWRSYLMPQAPLSRYFNGGQDQLPLLHPYHCLGAPYFGIQKVEKRLDKGRRKKPG